METQPPSKEIPFDVALKRCEEEFGKLQGWDKVNTLCRESEQRATEAVEAAYNELRADRDRLRAEVEALKVKLSEQWRALFS